MNPVIEKKLIFDANNLSTMEFSSPLAKAIHWVNLLVSDLEPAHIVKDCLWEYGCKHHNQKKDDSETSDEEFKKKDCSKNNAFQDKLKMDLIWQTEQPVMFEYVADRRTSMSKLDISFSEDEYLLAGELKKTIASLID